MVGGGIGGGMGILGRETRKKICGGGRLQQVCKINRCIKRKKDCSL